MLTFAAVFILGAMLGALLGVLAISVVRARLQSALPTRFGHRLFVEQPWRRPTAVPIEFGHRFERANIKRLAEHVSGAPTASIGIIVLNIEVSELLVRRTDIRKNAASIPFLSAPM